MTHEIETKQDLFLALKNTRLENGGIPLTEIAQIMREAFDVTEIDCLIKELK